MSALKSASKATPQYPPQESLRQRVSTAFEKLVVSAAELNAVSDELAEPVSAIEAALQKLGLGVSAWTVFKRIGGGDQHTDYDETWSIGYAKISQKWGLAIRYAVSLDGSGLPDKEEKWLFTDAPRAYRLEAVEKLPELIEKLAETSDKTATRLREGIALTKHVAETIGPMVPSKPGRRK